MSDVRVFWLTDPEADAIKSPFVRQPHYNDLENRIATLEGELMSLSQDDGKVERALVRAEERIAELESELAAAYRKIEST